LCKRIIENCLSIYVGDEVLIQKILAACLANGHVLFEDNPGLGKTLLAKTLAFSIGYKFSRVQFTPDLLPADILGTNVWKHGKERFELMKGPIFTNILLADEINRSPPKTQSALLEAMEERQATIEGETYRLSEPFLVMATQNPIEFEGTFPLPEAQVDRFLLKISTGYPKTVEEEELILRRRIDWRKDDPTRDIKPVVSQEEFLTLQKKVETSVYADGTILNYIAQIVRETRIHPKVEVGSSPRGGLALLKTGRAIALINGRDYVIPDDVKTFSVEALAHRLILKPEHILERTDEKEVVKEVISKVPVPKEYRPR
jgi:MoxR-like ATPase